LSIALPDSASAERIAYLIPVYSDAKMGEHFRIQEFRSTLSGGWIRMTRTAN
jgi:hypothetical protein